MIIPGYTNYDISESGVVTDLTTGKPLKHRKVRSQGYYTYVQVVLKGDDGTRRSHNVMRLLALTYIKKPDGLCMARPKDGDPSNITLSNIEWVPYSEAAKRAWSSGKMANRQPRAKCVTEESISAVYGALIAYDEPVTMAALSRELDIPYSAVRYSMYALIKRGKAKKLEEGFEAT